MLADYGGGANYVGHDISEGKIAMTTYPSKNTHRLGCRGYITEINVGEVIHIQADLIMYMMRDADAETIAEAQRRLAIFFCSGDIELIKSGDKPRCFYCASLNESDAKQCSQCGALL